MKVRTKTFLVFSFVFILGAIQPSTAKSATSQCRKIFDEKIISDITQATTKTDAGLFVKIINELTANLHSVPFGENNIFRRGPIYKASVENATQTLNSKRISFSDLAKMNFTLSETGADALRKKIRIFVENTYSLALAGRAEINFKYFLSLIKLAEYSEAESSMIIERFLESKLVGKDIHRTDILIPLILEQHFNPASPPFFKVIQNTKDTLLAVTNNRALKIEDRPTNDANFDDIGIDFTEIPRYYNPAKLRLSLDGRDYTLEVSSTPGKTFELFKTKEKPNITEMWKDKELQGTILIDADFTKDGSWLIDEYKDYYASQGFRFSRAQNKSIEDAFIKPFIQGQLDYIVAEHSNTVKLGSRVQVIQGIRETSRGTEKVQIIFALSNQSSQDGYSFNTSKELVRLLKGRAKNKIKNELILVNAKCYTTCDIQNIVEYIDTPHFTYIAPQYIAETFENSSTSPLVELITGIRKGTPYKEIQKRMEQSQRINFKENRNDTDQDDNTYPLPHLSIAVRTENRKFETKRKNYSVHLTDSNNKKLPVEFIPMHEAQ